MSFDVKNNLTDMKMFENKEEIFIANHRDDGDLKALRLKQNNGKAKMFDFKSCWDLLIKHKMENISICIAEDYFWTAMPFLVNREIPTGEEALEFITHCVVASIWGTPAIIDDNTGRMFACYKEIPQKEFPGVYITDWGVERLDEEFKEVHEHLENLINLLNKVKE